MLEESLRRRLEQLNRGILPPPTGSPQQLQRKPQMTRAIVQPKAVKPLPGLLRTAQVVATASGEHLRIRLPLERLWPNGSNLVQTRCDELLSNANLRNRQVELATLLESFPEQVVLMDLETCGLAGAALFLIGLLRSERQQLFVELLLARNYAEEPCVLESFWKTISANDVLVTFNGKSFDWPTVCDRSERFLLFRQSPRPEPLHVDLLHHARRRWKSILPDCRLQTIESQICRRRRIDDLPSQKIPAAYADYVRTGFPRDIEAVLYHNAVDLVTSLDIAMRLAY